MRLVVCIRLFRLMLLKLCLWKSWVVLLRMCLWFFLVWVWLIFMGGFWGYCRVGLMDFICWLIFILIMLIDMNKLIEKESYVV